MISWMDQLITDQAVLAMLPIVSLGVIVSIIGFFLIWKERRHDRTDRTIQKS